MAQSSIVIKGAREHNLKDIDVTIPRDELVVITGLSGSASHRLPSILSTPKVNDAMSKAFRAMHACSLAK